VRGSFESLVRIRRLLFERTLAEAARAASRVGRARKMHDGKKEDQALIESRREEVSDRLHVLQDARWLAGLLAFDRRLAEGLTRVRREVGLAGSDLIGRRNSLSRIKGELAGAQAKLLVAQNLDRSRRRAVKRQKERRMEVSGIRTRCL